MAFKRLKQSLIEAPVLGYPRPEGKLVLDTDASNHAVGAARSQQQDNVERVLAYYSQTHSRAIILCDQKGTFGHCESDLSVPCLLVRAPIHNPHRPYSFEVAPKLL